MHGSVCWVLRPTNFLEQCLCGRRAYLIFLGVESFTTAITTMCVRPSQDRLSRFIYALDGSRPRHPRRCESGAREAAIASMLACCKLRYKFRARPKCGFCEISNNFDIHRYTC